MAITMKQFQEASAVMNDQERADLQASLAGSLNSLIRETLQPALAQLADRAASVLSAQFASAASQIVNRIQDELAGNRQEIPLYVVVLDRPIRSRAPLDWPLLERGLGDMRN